MKFASKTKSVKQANPTFAILGLWLALAFSATAQPTVLFNESFNTFPGATWTVGDANAANGLNYWGAVDSAYGGEGAYAGLTKGYCAARTPTGTNLSAIYPVSMTSFASRAMNLTGFTKANLRFGYKVPSIGAGDSWRVLMDNSVVASGNTVQTNWTELSLNLNSFAGVNRTLRFEFISDANGTAEGMYLDGIEATATTSNVTETFGPLVFQNYTGYIIDADANTNAANFNREGLNTYTAITVENFQTTATNLPYRFTYWLRETNGVAFPIRAIGGVTNAAQNYVATNTISLGNGDRGSISNMAVLLPIGRLSHLTSYRIECEIARTNGVVLSRSTNGPYHFYHFTNTVSGDANLNVIAEHSSMALERSWLVNTIPDANTFVVTNRVLFHRYDDFAATTPGFDSLPLRFDLELRNATTGALVPLANSVVVTNVPIFDYAFGTSNPPEPRVVELPYRIEFRPATQLNSVDSMYRLIVRMSHTNQVGQPAIVDGSRTNGPTRFLAYNGTLLMGDITATMTNWSAGPIPGIVAPGVHINTVIHLGNKGAYVNGTPARFGDGTPLGTYLRVDGTTELAAGTQTMTGATFGQVGNISFLGMGVTFGPTGGEADAITFLMPSGFGYTTNIDLLAKRMFESQLTFSNVVIGQNLAPKGNLTLTPPPGATIYTSEESKPFYLIGNSLTWDAANSRFILTPSGLELLHHRNLDYYALELQRDNLVDPTMADHKSNDRLYNFVDKVNGNAFITADANGAARLTVDITFKAQGGFLTHFPYENFVGWNNGGTMSIVNDEVIVGVSSRLLTGGIKIIGQYSGDCEGCGATGTNNLIALAAPGGELRITRDGGVVTMGAAATLDYAANGASNKIAWGFIPSKNDYAQAVLAPTNAAFHMPGSFLLGQYNTSAKRDDAPGVLLLTGVAATNHTLIERPLTAAYQQGRADYAGVNIRTLGDGDRAGRSVLAGQAANYQLRGNSKYYARYGGVSGRHSAVGGTFPESLTLLGYGLTFSNYSLAFLDSRNVASKTEGLLRVPYPSNFELPFAELDFTCPGGLDHASIQDSSISAKLEWWNADIDALAIQFVAKPGEECDPGQGSLTVGVRAYASHINEPLTGVLGFKTNGTLIAPSDNIADIDSRLTLPVTFQFTGPKATNVNYNVTTVGRAYYAAYNPDDNKVPQGFLNFAGKLDVPFFEDLKIHAHVSGVKGQNGKATPIYLMGGWPRAGSGEPNQGWREGSDDFFNKPNFDSSNRGYPSGITQIVNYRNSGTTQYKPRAQKQWLDVVNLDYPLNWDSNGRLFKSTQSVSNDLFIVKVKHEVKSLNAKTADLTFGASYQGVPRISVGSFVADLGESSGVFDIISDAIGTSDASFLMDGLDAFGSLVGEGMEKMTKTIVDEAVTPILDPTYDAMKAAFAAAPLNNKWAFTNDMVLAISNFVQQVTNAVLVTADYTKQGNALIKEINGKLGEVDKGLTSAANMMLKASNAPVMVAKTLSKFSPGMGQGAGLKLSNMVETLEPYLIGASHTLTNIKQYIPPIRAQLTNGGEYVTQLDKIVKSSAAEIVSAAEAAKKELIGFFMAFDYSVDNPFSHMSKEQLKEHLRLAIEKRIMQLEMVSKLQSATKHRFYDVDTAFRGSIDSYFSGINEIVRSALEVAAAPIDDAINGATASVSKYMGAAQLNGHALINEDSLRLLRIDGSFAFKVPEEVKFKAFVEIKEMDSENSYEGCVYEGGTATEVRMGASDVPLKWISPGLKGSVGIGWVTGADGSARGVSGMFDVTGKLKFGGFTVKKAGFAVAFGEQENYFAANCRAKVGKSVEIAAGLFFGRACSYDPLKVSIGAVSPFLVKELKPETLFGPPPFTGGFVFAEGTFPVWSYGCLFEIRMTVGGGGWYFVEGPRYGGIVKVGAQGTVICVMNGGFDGTVIASQKSPDEGMVYVGSIKGKVSIGWCDFCIEKEDEAIWQKIGDGDFVRIDK